VAARVAATAAFGDGRARVASGFGGGHRGVSGSAEDLAAVAAEIASAAPHAGVGVLTGGVVALAAGLCESVARASLDGWDEARGAAVQAAELRRRACAAASENADAYGAANDALAQRGEPGRTGRDAQLRAALLRAADAPLAIATIAADCATLAAAIAQGCEVAMRADVAGTAELAAAAARSAAALVEINLALLPDDARRVQARLAVAAAEGARASSALDVR
jgi:formiminotetrahydrofolate cyclodeaminase